MRPIRLFAATGDAVARVDSPDGDRFEVALSLEGSGAQCLAVDPDDSNRVYVGTFDQGVYRSRDGGETWQQVGEAIPHKRVLSVAFAPARRKNGLSAIYAGTVYPTVHSYDAATGKLLLTFPDAHAWVANLVIESGSLHTPLATWLRNALVIPEGTPIGSGRVVRC